MSEEYVLAISEIDLKDFSYEVVPKTVTLKKKKQTISYNNVEVLYKGSANWNVILPKMFCFGVQEKVFEEGGMPKRTMSLVMKNRDGATPEQTEFITFLNAYVDQLTNWIVANRDKLGEYELEAYGLKTISPVYIKKEKGKPVDDYPPSLTCTLQQRGNTVLTEFYDEEGNLVNYKQLVSDEEKKTYFSANTTAVKMSPVYIPKNAGPNTRLRVMVNECEIERKKEREHRLLGGGARRRALYNPDDSHATVSTSAGASSGASRSPPSSPVAPPPPPPKSQAPPPPAKSDDENSSDDDDDAQKSPSPKKQPVRRASTIRRAPK